MSSNLSTLDVSNSIMGLTMEETRNLVFNMHVPLNILDDIAATYDGDNRKQHFVQKWLEMNPRATWNQLVIGLRKINKPELAEDIEVLHVPKCLVHYDPESAQVVDACPSIVNPVLNSDTKVEMVKKNIEKLEEEFTDIKFEARQSLTKRESQDSRFVEKFRDHLFDLPVSKKQVHIRFFSQHEDEILKAKTIQKLFIILGRYCNYSNYEIIFHVVKRFCHELKGRTLKYCDKLTSFEKSTTIDVFLCAISAHPGGEISQRFIRMTTTIKKSPSECTLYEIRELKESIEEKASVESYAMYIGSPEEGSVQVVLHVHKDVGWMVGVVLTDDFRQKNLVTEVILTKSRYESYHLTDYLSAELYYASERGDVGALTSLITAGADVNVTMWGTSALMKAVWNSRTEVVSLLLKAEAKINFLEWGESALMHAVRSGMSEIISLLLKAGADTYLQTDDGKSALMLATSWGWTEVVSLLVEAGANHDLQNKFGESSLIIAAKMGDTDIVSKLVKAGAALDLQTNRGDTAVILATVNSHLPVLKELVEARANVNLCNDEGLTALMISSRCGRTDLTGTLLSAELISLDIQTGDGWSALFFAVDKGDVETTEILISAGADPHQRDANGLTVFDVAAACGHRAVYELLTKYIQSSAILAGSSHRSQGLAAMPAESQSPEDTKHLMKNSRERARMALSRYDTESPWLIKAVASGATDVVSQMVKAQVYLDGQNEDGETALIIAVRKNNVKIVSLLVKAGASLDIQDKYGYTALIWAKTTEICSLLLGARASTDLQNKWGDSVLMLAAREGKTDLVSQLVKAGAALNLQNERGDSVLMMVVSWWWDNPLIFPMLLKAGANPDLQNKRGDSVLIMATREGRTEVIPQLVKAGAALDLQDNWGNTALMMAAKEGGNNIVSLLLKAGANPDLRNIDKFTALIMAVEEGRTKIVSMLVKAGAAVDGQNKRGDSAVILATIYGHIQILRELVKAGADLNLHNQEGLTALMISSKIGRKDLTQTLLSGKMICLDIQSHNGWSALFFAVDDGDVATTELLLKAGANPHLRDNSGLTVVNVAAACGHSAVHQLLRKHAPADSGRSQIQSPRVKAEVHTSQKTTQSGDSSLERLQHTDTPHKPSVPPDSSHKPTGLSHETASEETTAERTTVVMPEELVQTPSVTLQQQVSEVLKDLVKEASLRGKQTFNRLERRIFRSDKMFKIHHKEPGSIVQKGEKGVREKPKIII